MRQKYIKPKTWVIQIQAESLIAMSYDGTAELPGGGFTPFESQSKNSVWNYSNEIWDNPEDL